MKQKIVFATNNAHKLREVRAIAGDKLEILSLADIGCYEDLPETSDTIEGNALQKAKYVKENYGYDCFADDTGLCVEALGGAPGVHTARYACDSHDSEANMKLLLENMKDEDNRNAYFITVIALMINDMAIIFEGKAEGTIAREKKGEEGFGYDPVFFPKGSELSFAEMDQRYKNAISHRGKATAQLMGFLLKNFGE